jgi:hypothetical protein
MCPSHDTHCSHKWIERESHRRVAAAHDTVAILDGGEGRDITVFRRVSVGPPVLTYRRHDLLDADSRRRAPIRGPRQCPLAMTVRNAAIRYSRRRLQRLDLEYVPWLRALDEHRSGHHKGRK